jgi:hypothetical protein
MSAQGSANSVPSTPANDPVFVPSIKQDEMPDSLSAEAVAAIRATVEPAKDEAPEDTETPPETYESLADDEQPEEEVTEEDAADDATDGDEEGAEAGKGTDAQPDGFDRAADLADFRAMLRGEKPAAEPITPSAGKADAAKPTASAGPNAQADSGTSTNIDPDALVQTFKDEFGDEAANAIAPVFKQVAEMQKQLAALTGEKQQATQAQRVVQIHKFLDTKADAGLADKIGNGAKGTLTKAQIDNRIELVETARLYAQKEQARGRTLTDDEAIAKAARFLFDVQIPAGKPSAPSRIDAKVEARNKAKTLRPRGSVRSQEAAAISDDDTYGLPPEAKDALKAATAAWKKMGLDG